MKAAFSLTFDYTNGFCGLYRDCSSINPDECAQCLSGEELCSVIASDTSIQAFLNLF